MSACWGCLAVTAVSESTHEPLTSHLLTAPACCLVDLPGTDEKLLSVLAGRIVAGFGWTRKFR